VGSERGCDRMEKSCLPKGGGPAPTEARLLHGGEVTLSKQGGSHGGEVAPWMQGSSIEAWWFYTVEALTL
jgi:hypothetical protein